MTTSEPNMAEPILIWGAGAIGATIAAYWKRAGVEVLLVDIVEEHVEACRTDGLVIEGPVEEFKLQIPAGQANPAPPVGPALGQQGVNIMEFCKQYTAVTKDKAGLIIPVVITVYSDKSFSFITKSPPAAVLLKKAAGIASGSGEPNKTKVGKVTKAQLLEIVEAKKEDLNARDPEMAANMIAGTARSMGLEVVN